MRIVLAGYNLDSSIFEQVRKTFDKPDALTPETIAVAYARISRDPSPVTELREKAINDVEAARRSARSIIFDLNHQSVAEHAAFNFDILDISRLCVEALQWHRLGSYTEKSQRYQELPGDFVLPEEFQGESRSLFKKGLVRQNEVYAQAIPVLLDYFRQKYPDKLSSRSDLQVVEGYAKEDARYAMGLAARAQLGFTSNARNLEYIIRSLRAHPLHEMQKLGGEFYRLAGAIAPSLILLTDPVEYEREFGRPLSEDYFTETHPFTEGLVAELMEEYSKNNGSDPISFPSKGSIKLIDYSSDPDRNLLIAILHSHSSVPAELCSDMADYLLGINGKAKQLIKGLLKHSNSWEAATREFEMADFTFEVVLSAACFGQMKRHRMMTIIKQPYSPERGYIIPESIKETGQEGFFKEIMEKSEEAFGKLNEKHPESAAYILTNAHKRRIVINANLRELYHIARLRMDSHAQWDIQNVSAEMIKGVKKAAPLTAALACGKDTYKEVYKKFFKE